MEHLLQGLRAAAEDTRLRILALCGRTELSVSELTHILGQSQPRVSRHLKRLVDAGLLERFREGTWAFYRISERGGSANVARQILTLVDDDDPIFSADNKRLQAVRARRTEQATAFFKQNAAEWDRIRRMHVDDTKIEQALRRLLPKGAGWELVDIGTGTGRILEALSPNAHRAVGIDLSREMLMVARSNLAKAELTNCHVRHGDMQQLPLPPESYDVATFHLVLHYAADPAGAIAEAARVLRPEGQLIIIDFAPHREEHLVREHAHLRMGFTDAEISNWFTAAGLVPQKPVRLPGNPLTVCLWAATRPAEEHPATTRTQEGAATWQPHQP